MLLYIAESEYIPNQLSAGNAANEIRENLAVYLQRNIVSLDFLLIGTYAEVNCDSQSLEWRNVYENIVGICIAFASLQLPSYVLLWIVDYLPDYHLLSHLKKIRLIEKMTRRYRKIIGIVSILIVKNIFIFLSFT